MLRLKKTGQSTAEYAIVIGLVIAAAVAMQVYVKRGIQAKIAGAVDFRPDTAGTAITFKSGQYEPYYASSSMNTTRNASEQTTTNTEGEVTREILAGGEVTQRWGTQNTAGVQ